VRILSSGGSTGDGGGGDLGGEGFGVIAQNVSLSRNLHYDARNWYFVKRRAIDQVKFALGYTNMSRPKRGLLSRRPTRKAELTHHILSFGETYHGREIVAVSEADLIAQRAAIDRQYSQRLLDAKSREERAQIIAEEYQLRAASKPVSPPRPPRRRPAEAESTEE